MFMFIHQLQIDVWTKNARSLGLDKNANTNETDLVSSLKKELVDRTKEISAMQSRISELRIRLSAQESESQLKVCYLLEKSFHNTVVGCSNAE
jgi:hypothetical protein